MSYILDALKKSDQERQQGNNPTLQTIHKPHFTGDTSSKWQLVALLMALLIVSLVALVGWYLLVYSGGEGQSDKLASERVLTNSAEQLGALPAQEVVAIVAHDRAPQSMAVDQRDEKNVVVERPVIDTVVEFWELPDPVQQEIPSLTFSFHVYSANADRRTIIINKRRIKEGAVVSEGLTLIEITKTGVVLDWKKRYRFMINVVENW